MIGSHPNSTRVCRRLTESLIHARSYARGIALEFAGRDVGELANRLADDLDAICVASRKLAFGLARARAGRFGFDPDFGFECDPESNHAHARNVARDIASDIYRAHVRTRDIARYTGHDYERVKDLALIIERTAGHTEYIRDKLSDVSLRSTSDSAPSVAAAVMVSAVARRVVGYTARLLPTQHRARMAEEFAGELYGIAAAGGSRRRQLAHALRVLVCVVPLRRALSSPRRRAVDRG